MTGRGGLVDKLVHTFAQDWSWFVSHLGINYGHAINIIQIGSYGPCSLSLDVLDVVIQAERLGSSQRNIGDAL